MFNKLSEIIKKLQGNVLVIGLDDKLLEIFDNNNSVNLYSIYSSNLSNKKSINSKKKQTNKGELINIKKLRKYINKKSVDHLIINMDEVIRYYKYIIKDTIYLNNNLIYIYSSNKIDKDFIIKKYKRYNVKITFNNYKTGYVIIIDNTTGKNNFIKDILFFISDTIYNITELIGNILVS